MAVTNKSRTFALRNHGDIAAGQHIKKQHIKKQHIMENEHIYIVCVRKNCHTSHHDTVLCAAETLAVAQKHMWELIGNAEQTPATSGMTTLLRACELPTLSDNAVYGARLGGVLDDLYFEYYVAKIPCLPQAEHKELGTTRPAELEKFLKFYH